MSSYNFETMPSRLNAGSSKWQLMLDKLSDVDKARVLAPDSDIIPLSVADMEFETAPEIADALAAYAREQILGYTSPNDAFYEAVQSWESRRHHYSPAAEIMVTTPGVVPAFFAAVGAFTKPGDKILIQQPVYYPFMRAIKSQGRTIVNNALVKDAEGTYQIDFEDFEAKAQDPGTKMFILCSPHNPVGRMWTVDELTRMVEICVKHDVFIVCDEIHQDFKMCERVHTTLLTLEAAAAYDKVMVCTAPSKTFNIAGTQASIIFVPDADVRAAYKAELERRCIGQLNCFAYEATRAAYTLAEPWLDALLDKMRAHHQLVHDFGEKTKLFSTQKPEATYLAWMDFTHLGIADAELQKRFEKALVFGDAGSLFGPEGEGYLRLNLACPTRYLEAALNRLEEELG